MLDFQKSFLTVYHPKRQTKASSSSNKAASEASQTFCNAIGVALGKFLVGVDGMEWPSSLVEQLENQLKLGNLEAKPRIKTAQPHLHLELLNSGV